jgi:hypothetical protein
LQRLSGLPILSVVSDHQQLEMLRKHHNKSAGGQGGGQAALKSDMDEQQMSVQLHNLVKQAFLLHRQDVDWALRVGGCVWALAATFSALVTASHPWLMLLAALTMAWGSVTAELFPATGPLTWLVHVLLASGSADASSSSSSSSAVRRGEA